MPSQTSATYVDAPLSDAEVQRMALSVWVDGEVNDQTWSDAWATDSDAGVQEAWHRYQIIGDVLRAGQNATLWAGSSNPMDSASAVSFARRVTDAARQQGPLTQLDLSSVAPSAPARFAPKQAANDGVYRWKMVAGVASFTAVLGIAWGVAGGVGQGGAVLAKAPAAAPMVQVADSTPVLVSTPQGPVLRDARLQELMQTHRQLGGASVLQAPAGFLRTSTLEIQPR